MGRTKRKKGERSKKQGGLSGFTDAISKRKGKALGALGGMLGVLAAGIAAGGAGAAMGRHSLLASAPVAFIGAYTENKYIIAAAVGLAACNVPSILSGNVNGVDGFDLKQIAQNAKDRVGQYFDNFKEKLYIPASKSDGTNGLQGGEEVKYFINPYNSNDIDMSALDRVNDEVLAMNEGTAGLFDIDREF